MSPVWNDAGVSRDRPAAPVIPAATSDFTPRELDVLRLLTTGSFNQAIAYALFLSLPTVKGHVATCGITVAHYMH